MSVSKKGMLVLLLAGLLSTASSPLSAAEAKAAKKAAKTPERISQTVGNWADFIEPDFPFISSVLDARKLGPGWPENNLTPRGLILNLGHDCWACFDTDLLRISAIWTGKAVTTVSMAQGSYHVSGVKAPGGQKRLPQIDGQPWIANGIYPGWQTGAKISLTDPREPGPDPKEVGRGPISPKLGQFKAVRETSSGLVLEYTVAGVNVEERISARVENNAPMIQRSFHLASVPQDLWLLLGQRPQSAEGTFAVVASNADLATQPDGLQTLRVHRSSKPVYVQVAMSLSGRAHTWPEKQGSEALNPPARRWPQSVTTSARLSTSKDAYVVDDIAIPSVNPWKRNVRFADITFYKDGRAAVVTFDGDVWMVSGLKGDLTAVKWQRYSSGFQEPMGICLRGEELFVCDRNGIWRLRDTDGNGEADVHELFSNAYGQTAETREFATGFRVTPDGAFIISKGGQQESTLGKHNGSVLRIAPDGQSATVIGWGLREPFISVNPKTGLVMASDQQGNYVPSTPLHIIRDHQYYGFLSSLQPKEKYPAPIADPLTWIPHPINASSMSQVWLTDARMGPLNDALIHIGYYRPELFLVRLNERGSRMQASVTSLTREFKFGPINGAVDPADGQLYVIGFQIWGTVAERISGLVRVRYTGAPNVLPREVVPMDKGVLLRFDVPLDPEQAANPANYSAERWNYKRTASYGSPHFKLDGTKGQENMVPSSAYVSKDHKSVFIGIPDMKYVMQMRFGWSLATAAGQKFDQNTYFTPYEFPVFNPVKEGFDAITVDLTPRMAAAAEATPITVAEGARVAELMGCVACHSNDGSTLGKVGPSWKGLFGSKLTFAGGGKGVANEDYIRESIKEPAAKIVRGFEKSEAGMPSYEGVISDAQIEALVLYIKSLK